MEIWCVARSTPWTGLEQVGKKALTINSPPTVFLPTNTCELQRGLLEDKERPEGRAIVAKWMPHVLKAVREGLFYFKTCPGSLLCKLTTRNQAVLPRAL